jgi:hypothetical protein
MDKSSKKEYYRLYHLKNREKKCLMAKKYYYANKKRIREQAKRNYLKNRNKILKNNREYKHKKIACDPIYRETLRRQAREHYKKHKEYYKIYHSRRKNSQKVKARELLYTAIKYGKIKRPDRCEYCKKKCTPDGHHFMGYTFPLKVMWLCRICHSSLHF